MLVETYTLEIINNHCIPGAMSVNAIAHLSKDISCVVPFINSSLGGSQCTSNPPSVTFKTEGKLISVQDHTITVNGIQDETHGRKIIDWMIREINDAWENREQISPSYELPKRPVLTELLKLLPMTNCRKCGEPTCMVFAVRLTEGAKDENHCPDLTTENRSSLQAYLAHFTFE